MAKSKVYRLGDLQLMIMKVLWLKTEAAVGDVHSDLCKEGDWAYTTIATMLRKLEARGLVRHRLVERKFLYRAALREEEVTQKISTHFIERLFEGSLSDMVAHLLTTRHVSRDELERLETLIAERKKKL